MANDFIKTNIGKQLTGLYYYILDMAHLTDNNSRVYGFAPTIQNISFNPFIEFDDVDEVECVFDRVYFGMTNPSGVDTPMVYRIRTFSVKDKIIGEFNIDEYYNTYGKDSSGNLFESKILMYPYRYFVLTDYINPPLVIQPQLMHRTSEGKWRFMVKIGLSQTSKYNLYAYRYKGDNMGNLEGIINNNPLLYPVSSNQYSSWFMSNGNSFVASNNLALMENDLSLRQGSEQIALDRKQNNFNAISGVGGAVASALTGNIGGAIGGAISTGFNYGMGIQQNNLNQSHLQQNTKLKEYSIETMALARVKDYLNTPRAIKTVGNDGVFAMSNAHYKVDLLEYGMTNSRYLRIYAYFERYGYKVNKYMKPNFRSRKYYNFVKTVNCNIDSARIPHNDLIAIQEIFNSGITFWHIDNGATVKNYDVTNIEV